MEYFQIRGAGPLRGETAVSGAKNAALPILAACVLCRGPCVLYNCPEIADVETTLAILRALGAKAERCGAAVVVDAAGLTETTVPAALAARMRSSVLFAGALLSVGGSVKIPLPGGCPLGERPINYHLWAFEQLGAKCLASDGYYEIFWERPRGTVLEFLHVSVGATENAILAALRCPGETVLKNAAKEPEITDLVNFLRSAGAEISGAGTSELHIRGDQPLHGTTYSIQPDRIETATFLCAAAGCGGEVLLRRTDARMLGPFSQELNLALLRQTGCELLEEQDAVLVRKTGKTGIISDVKTAAYPGFPTDCQAILTAALLRAEGESRIEETVFEDRFHHVPELKKLGAKLEIHHNTVHISRVRTLSGAKLTARDLRGGAALVLAAMQAEGESRVEGLTHIDRGYERFAEKLRALGANIERCFDA